jgi:hypothetical protein
MEKLFAHTSEEGSRQLVWGAVGEMGNETRLRGTYISSSQVQEASDDLLGAEGRRLQDKIWVCAFVLYQLVLSDRLNPIGRYETNTCGS